MNTLLLAFLNTLWQSTAIAAAVWLLLKLARGTNAATRHAVWWATLAVVVLLPMIPRRAPVVAQASRPQALVAAVPRQEADRPADVSPAKTAGSSVPRSGVEVPAGSWTW